MNRPTSGAVRHARSLLVPSLLVLVTACSVSTRRAGVANLWREEGRLSFQTGSSTTKDVLAKLGPPSQLIDLGGRTVFYYLLEQSENESLFLMVYNDSATRIQYDRAIFIFDANGVLQEMAVSQEALPGDKPRGEDGN